MNLLTGASLLALAKSIYYTCIDVNDVLTVEDTINALRIEAVVKQLTRRYGFCCLVTYC